MGREVVRVLSCGHKQVEANGGKAHLADSARCFTCYPKSDFVPPPPKTEKPTGATVVKQVPVVVIAQIKGVRCSAPSQHEELPPESFQCEKCFKRICGHCESTPNAGLPCDACWLKGAGVA